MCLGGTIVRAIQLVGSLSGSTAVQVFEICVIVTPHLSATVVTTLKDNDLSLPVQDPL